MQGFFFPNNYVKKKTKPQEDRIAKEDFSVRCRTPNVWGWLLSLLSFDLSSFLEARVSGGGGRGWFIQ